MNMKAKKEMMPAVEAVKSNPTMYLEDDDVIDGIGLGDEITLTVDAKCTSLSQDSGGMGADDKGAKEHKSQRFEILGVTRTNKSGAAFAAKAQRAMKGVAA